MTEYQQVVERVAALHQKLKNLKETETETVPLKSDSIKQLESCKEELNTLAPKLQRMEKRANETDPYKKTYGSKMIAKIKELLVEWEEVQVEAREVEEMITAKHNKYLEELDKQKKKLEAEERAQKEAEEKRRQEEEKRAEERRRKEEEEARQREEREQQQKAREAEERRMQEIEAERKRKEEEKRKKEMEEELQKKEEERKKKENESKKEERRRAAQRVLERHTGASTTASSSSTSTSSRISNSSPSHSTDTSPPPFTIPPACNEKEEEELVQQAIRESLMADEGTIRDEGSNGVGSISLVPISSGPQPDSTSSSRKVVGIDMKKVESWFDLKSANDQQTIINRLIARKKSQITESYTVPLDGQAPPSVEVPPAPDEKTEQELIEEAIQASLKDQEEYNKNQR